MGIFKKLFGKKKSSSEELSEKITDKTKALAAVKDAGWELADVSDELKADKEVVMAAVKSFNALQYASDELKADKEVVMAVVSLRGWSLHYASDELKADKEVVMAAVKDDGRALENASDELKTDPEVLALIDD